MSADDPLDELRRASMGDSAPPTIRPGSDEARFLDEISDAVAILGDVTGQGAGWAESATETLVGIALTVERTGRVTEKQDGALRNIRKAAERWL